MQTTEGRRDVGGRLAGHRLLAALAAVVVAVIGGAAGAAAGPALVHEARPGSTVSPDGLTATAGPRTLRVSQATDLALGGQAVSVSGSGYDVSKGIYVALCLVTPPDQAPTPCGGGADQSGRSGASAWISSHPPSYGEGLATPYGGGGTFSVSVTVSPVLAGGYDCRQVQCALVSRNDHVRTADRSQDLLVPVRFGTGTTPPPSTAPSTTLAPPPPPSTTAPPPSPPATLSDDGRTATSAGRTVTVSVVDDLDPAGSTLTVTGEGFDESKGVLVSLCRVAAGPTEAPGPCLAGSTPGASRWVSSSPPEYAADLVVPYEDSGRFSVELDVAPEIDGETDCREVACAVVVRRDDVDAADRTLDVAVPVAFGAERHEPAPTPTEPATTEPAGGGAAAAPVGADESGDGGPGSALPWVLLALVGVAAGAAAAVLVARSRRFPTPAGPAAEGPA